MSDFDFEPLIRQEQDELVLAVIGSGKEERPASGARDRALSALGLSATTSAPLQALARVKIAGMKTVLGVVGIAVLGTLTASIVGSTGGDRPRLETSLPPTGDTVGESTGSHLPNGGGVGAERFPLPVAIAMSSAVNDPVVTPEMLPRASDTRLAPSVATTAHPLDRTAKIAKMLPGGVASSSTSPSESSRSSTLERETAQVDAARRSLSRGQMDQALARLDAYDREFPRGAFTLEVAVLRIEALCRAQRTAEAERRAAVFLSEHPTGPYARRVKAALEGR